MDALNDDCLLLIFREFPLNERTNLRLVSKRFKRLLDTIAIKKLVVYIQNEPLPGKLAFTDEPYDLVDTVCVSDAGKFFASPIILRQLSAVQTLVIFGRSNQFSIKATFRKLKYLEMNDIFLESPEILKSPSVECLKLHNSTYIDPVALRFDTSIAERSFRCLGFGKHRSNLKHFSLQALFDTSFYTYLHKSGVCASLQEIHFMDVDFKALIYLSKNYGSLRVIDIIIADPRQIAKLASKQRLQEIANGFPPALSVYLYGILWNQKTSANVHYFLEKFANLFYFNAAERRLVFRLFGQPTCELLKSVDRTKCDLRKFCQSVGVLNMMQPNDQLGPLWSFLPKRKMDEEVFRRFSNCQSVIFDPLKSFVPFEKFVSIFPDLREIILSSSYGEPYGKDLLDLIGEKCPRLERLTVCHWDDKKADFRFLFKLTRLNYLKLLLFRPIDSSVLLELLKRARFITYVSICFVRPTGQDKSELSAFKKLVNETLGERFEANKLAFCIQIHTDRRGRQFVRYALQSVEYREHDPRNEIDELDKETMLELLNFRAS